MTTTKDKDTPNAVQRKAATKAKAEADVKDAEAKLAAAKAEAAAADSDVVTSEDSVEDRLASLEAAVDMLSRGNLAAAQQIRGTAL